ncbi:T9SS type A sorting domain-containing protein [Candidatus Amoebophilus asiaticus]|nr:T9SS type A sorting domain-containing protein [Candidatus Amoebophilus asiaticus]
MIHGAIVRNDQTNVSGIKEEIGRLFFTIDSTISNIDHLSISYTNSGGVMANQTAVNFNQPADPDTITIDPDYSDIDNMIIKKKSISIFPNPSGGDVSIQLANLYRYINLKLFNQLGQEIYSRDYYNIKNILLDINNFVPGAYILQLRSERLFLPKQIYIIR